MTVSRRLGAVVLAALIGGCGAGGGTGDFPKEASATCEWARESVEVLPERTSRLLRKAADRLRRLDFPEERRAAAVALTADFGRLSRSAEKLSSELDADRPDLGRMLRLRAAVRDGQRKIDARTRTLGVSGCDAMASVLLREVTYRTRLRDGVGDLLQRTHGLEAVMRSGTGSPSTLTSYAASVGTAVSRLEPLRPPARVASAHRDLVAGLAGLRDAVTRVVRGQRAGGPRRALQILERFYASQAFANLTAATATLSRRGYLPS